MELSATSSKPRQPNSPTSVYNDESRNGSPVKPSSFEGSAYSNGSAQTCLSFFVWPSPDNLRKHWPVIQRRLKPAVISSPKFFFAAFFWEAFGYAATARGANLVSACYFLMTGLGTLVGFLLTSFAIIALTKWGSSKDDLITEVHGGVVVFCVAMFTAGTLWQIAVNISIYHEFDFTGAFFFVYFICGLAIFGCVLLVRSLNEYLLPQGSKFRFSGFNTQTIRQDFTVALCGGAADAFFVGTEDRFSDSWLRGFQVDRSTPTFSAICLAGASGFCGYLLLMPILCVILADGVLFVDPPLESPSKSKEGEMTELATSSNPVFESKL